jgi:uncharacterized membrane protein
MTKPMPAEKSHANRDGRAQSSRLQSVRLDSIDLVRGLVMVIMALDHVKGTFTNVHYDATDLTKTTPIFFLTRWVTHFCAPTFVFLAGTGAFLYRARGKTTPQLAWFLLSRGVWLIVLELTVIRFSWFLNVNYAFSFGQVIWAIGWSMILLSALVYLPTPAVTVFGVSMMAFHNLFDGVTAAGFGRLDWLWKVLHTGEGIEPVKGYYFAPFYPLIPWLGVMAAGFGFGALFLQDRPERRRNLLGLGLALTALFIGLRFTNVYGDRLAAGAGQPGPWAWQSDGLFTLLSFINCQKYPPSLLFLLMTLGPAITALAVFDREPGPLGRVFVIFGRVPLFFYLLHWYVIKGLLLGLTWLRYGRVDWLFAGFGAENVPEDNGYDLWIVYLIWLGVVAFLFPLCYWFAGVKQRSRSAWLSYL